MFKSFQEAFERWWHRNVAANAPEWSEDIQAHNGSLAPVERTLGLMKGKEYYCFRYHSGEERQVLDALIEMVNQEHNDFDWFDGAVLSHQLGQYRAKKLRIYLPKKAV